MKCQLCNRDVKNFRSLSTHIRYNHKNFNSKSYYEKFLLKKNEGICKLENCENKTNFQKLSSGFLDFCCVRHAQLSPETKAKIEKTCLKKYNTRSTLQNKKVREKAKQTKLKKYGNENYNNRKQCAEKLLNRTNDELDEWKEKVRKKWKEKTTEEKKEIHERGRQTYLNKTGIDLNDSYLNYARKLGVENISQSKEWKEKVKNTWENKTQDELAIKKMKQESTMFDKYGVLHNMYDHDIKKRVIKKGRETKIKNGSIIPDEMLDDFNLYKRRVARFTYYSKKIKFTKEELSKRGKCGVKGAYQIDHMYSIKEGFLNNIPPFIIGSIFNLTMIKWEDNDKKKNGCSITKEKLFELFYK